MIKGSDERTIWATDYSIVTNYWLVGRLQLIITVHTRSIISPFILSLEGAEFSHFNSNLSLSSLQTEGLETVGIFERFIGFTKPNF